MCEGTSVISSILIILAVGEVDSGDDSSSLIASWTEAESTCDAVVAPLTSSMSILLRGF